jgi:glycosyltransferase involved in cell wall biosynthesis
MRVLFLTVGPIEHPSSRHRVYQYLDYLEKMGIQCTVSPALTSSQYRQWSRTHWQTSLMANLLAAKTRLFDLSRARRFDVILMQRNILSPVLPPVFETLLNQANGSTVFDFDDLIVGSSYSRLLNGRYARIAGVFLRNRVHTAIGACRCVIVGSPYLRERAEAYSDDVTLIPTSVDLRRYTPRPQKTSCWPIVIGFKGGRATSVYLGQLRPVFDGLHRRYGSKLKVIVHGVPDFPVWGPYIEIWPFRLESELVDLQSFDIGIMPLHDDEHARGKCAFKALEYMAVGIPCVSSRVGVINDIVQDGGNGFLASTSEEWIEKLSSLIDDEHLRASMGREGRQTVEEGFTIDVNAPKLVAVLNRAANGR